MPDGHLPEDMPGRMPEDMPDRMPEDVSDRMPEDLPVTKCINVMMGITRSKVIVLCYTPILSRVTPPAFLGLGRATATPCGFLVVCRDGHKETLEKRGYHELNT